MFFLKATGCIVYREGVGQRTQTWFKNIIMKTIYVHGKVGLCYTNSLGSQKDKRRIVVTPILISFVQSRSAEEDYTYERETSIFHCQHHNQILGIL